MTDTGVAPESRVDTGDRSTSWKLVFLVAVALAILLQIVLAARTGGVTGLLHVGEESAARPYIEDDFGRIHLWENRGHDGRFSYAIATDPFLEGDGTKMVDDVAYRYRRYLYSFLAGMGGLLPPSATVIGLMVMAAVGVGLVAAASVDVAEYLGVDQGWGLVAGLANFGMLISAMHLSSDALAFGLSLLGVMLVLRDRPVHGIVAMSAAVLTKEVYVLVALSLAASLWIRRRGRRAVLVGAVPLAVVGAWTLAWGALAPTGSLANYTLDWRPFGGLVQALGEAPGPGSALVYQGLILMCAVVTVYAMIRLRDPLLRWLPLPWLALMAVSSIHVWSQDAPRTLAPLWTFAFLALGMLLKQRREGVSRRSAWVTTQHGKHSP